MLVLQVEKIFFSTCNNFSYAKKIVQGNFKCRTRPEVQKPKNILSIH